MRAWVVMLGVLAGCSRELSVPEVGTAVPGTVTGRTVIAVPGKAERQAVKDAVVSLQSSTASVKSNDAGAFVLEGITTTTGALLFRYDADGDGVFELQKLVRLEDIGAGPRRAVAMGDVVLADAARLHGSARRGDRLNQRGGHGGTVVFVPEGPFTAYTNDDGSFAIEQLPEGPLQLAAFRTGYQGATISGLTARAGEDLQVRELVLDLETGNPPPGSITGQLSFVPAADSTGATVVAVSLTSTASFNATVQGDGTFQVSAVPPGVYDLRASRPDYTTTTAPNVIVRTMAESEVQITMGKGPSNEPQRPDGGMLPLPDGGGPSGTCTTTADCASSEWCDDGLCVPQCSSSAQCTNGRVCDSATRTCVLPCSAGCPMGLSCELTTNLCRTFCEVSLPCPGGYRCTSAQVCVPECAAPSDCPAHRTCQAGACVFDGTCAVDLDCPTTDICVSAQCRPRMNPVGDGGYSCAMACDCRSGEICSGGVCITDVLTPDRFLAAGGTGNGLSPATAAGALSLVLTADASVSVAVHEADLVNTTPDAGIVAIINSRTKVAGGYVQCGTDRWVRDDTKSSTLYGGLTSLVQIPGTLGRKITDVSLLGLDLTGELTCPPLGRFIEASYADRLSVRRVTAAATRTGICGGATGISHAVVSAVETQDLEIDTLTLRATQPVYDMTVVSLDGGSGTLARVSAAPQSLGMLSVARINRNSGPVTVRDCDQGELILNVAVLSDNHLVSATSCGAPVTIASNRLSFPSTTSSNGIADDWVIAAAGCAGLVIDANHVDGRVSPGPFPTNGSGPHLVGVHLRDSTGTLTGNRIDLPRVTNSVAQVAGLYLAGPRASFAVTDNTITAPLAVNSQLWGVRVDSLTQPGTLTFRNLVVDAGFATNNAAPSSAFAASNVGAQAGLKLIDCDLKAPSMPTGSCLVGSTTLQFTNSAGYVERGKINASSGTNPFGVVVDASQVELYGSFVTVGSNTCTGSANVAGGASAALALIGTASVFASGNTFEVNSDPVQTGYACAVRCQSPAGSLVATGNIFGAGGATDHTMLCTTGIQDNCYSGGAAANFSSNYFWYSRPGARSLSERVQVLTPSDGGLPDSRGNIVGENANPYGGAAQPTYVLGAGSPCIDKGVGAGVRKDASVITTDIDGRPRRNGAELDIGAYER